VTAAENQVSGAENHDIMFFLGCVLKHIELPGWKRVSSIPFQFFFVKEHFVTSEKLGEDFLHQVEFC